MGRGAAKGGLVRRQLHASPIAVCGVGRPVPQPPMLPTALTALPLSSPSPPCSTQTNFFEKRVGDYQKAGVMASLNVDPAHAMAFNEDF